MNIVKGEFKQTGINEVDIQFIQKKWNHLWFLSEWKRDNSWRIIKYLRKDSPITSIKLTISIEQAKEIIQKLNLKSENVGLASGFSWRKEKDVRFLEKWRLDKQRLS